jgi:hypothetical protein
MTDELTGAPTDVVGGITTTDRPTTTSADPFALLSAEARATFAAVADHLIPAAHGMPSAATVVDEARLRFVLASRPDLADAVAAALRPELGGDVGGRLEALARDEPANLSALQLAIVGGYYTDKQVRELIGYPGQEAITIRSWEVPAYLEEGLIDAVIARGPVWRDPATGRRPTATDAPRTYAERFATRDAGDGGEGGTNGHDRR